MPAIVCAVLLSPLVFAIVAHVPLLDAYPFRRVFNHVAQIYILGALVVPWKRLDTARPMKRKGVLSPGMVFR